MQGLEDGILCFPYYYTIHYVICIIIIALF